MKPMSSAPKDGTRILIHHHKYIFVDYGVVHKKSGTAISECWWDNGTWNEWCGATNRSSTEYINPIEWAPRPKTKETWG